MMAETKKQIIIVTVLVLRFSVVFLVFFAHVVLPDLMLFFARCPGPALVNGESIQSFPGASQYPNFTGYG